ncbi:MAG: TolC family protein [Bacteroidales bacterium]
MGRIRLIFLIVLFLSANHESFCQKVLDEYVAMGLERNLALKQKAADYSRSIESLREAKGLFYPGLSLNARYTVSQGGRVIEFPIGDMLNPVYTTLNALTSSNAFPLVENSEIRFLRPTEHETKLRLIQPVINTDIYYNSRITKELSVFEQHDYEQYRRELVAEIKKSYFNAAMTSSVLRMLEQTRPLLDENIRVNRKLVENGKAVPDFVFRSEAELAKFDQEVQVAVKNSKLAVAYFNFLLNRPLGDSIIFQEPSDYPSITGLTSTYVEPALANREEIKKLENYRNVTDYQIRMSKSGVYPEVFLAVDYGFQGETYRFNNNTDYVQASAVLSWNIFSGWKNRTRVRQAIIDKSIVEDKLEETRKQIELQVINSLNELMSAEKAISAAELQLKNSREAFRLVSRRYNEGQASLIEFIDARSTLTQSEENLIIRKYTYLSVFAEFEKITVSGL